MYLNPNFSLRLQRPPPPPIQMYSMADDSGGASTAGGTGPIYDTINDDSGSYSKSNGSDNSEVGSSGIGAPPTASVGGLTPMGTTFGMPVAPPLPPSNGYQNGGRVNGGFVPGGAVPPGGPAAGSVPGAGGGGHEYDVPEGQEPAANGRRPSGAVTINGITV